MLEVLGTIISAVSVAGVIFILVNWNVHISQTKEFCEKYGYGNFKLFKREFNKIHWERVKYYKSFFGEFDSNKRDYISEIHASIIKFNGNGMLLNPIDYLIFEIWRFNQFKVKKEKIKWR